MPSSVPGKCCSTCTLPLPPLPLGREQVELQEVLLKTRGLFAAEVNGISHIYHYLPLLVLYCSYWLCVLDMFDSSLLEVSIDFRAFFLLLMAAEAKGIDTPEGVTPGKHFCRREFVNTG